MSWLRGNVLAGLVVGLGVAGMLAYRAVYVEPLRWVSICTSAAATANLACVPRAALLWLQDNYVWGGAALLLGLVGFFGQWRRISVAAVVIGADAVINYNATWGMLGLALGAWTWMMPGAKSGPVRH